MLAAAVAVSLTGTGERAKVDITKIQIEKVSTALELYRTHMNRYPSADRGGLRALIDQPDDEEERKLWGGPYIKAKDLKDAWNQDLVNEYPGRNNERRFDLSSAGPDGDAGSDDDITNWERD
jgi:general secretion pathway protein G